MRYSKSTSSQASSSWSLTIPPLPSRIFGRAYNGFRRMGLDADTAETAALLARACLALDRDAEADELCTESERLAGHALKAVDRLADRSGTVAGARG